MKLLLDQDVYAVACRHLRASGHDVATAADRGQSRTADFELLAVALIPTLNFQRPVASGRFELLIDLPWR